MIHRISMTEVASGRIYWECSCGASGSCNEFLAELRSDDHIRYDHGEKRIDVNKL